MNDKRRHLVVKEATLINKWRSGGRWKVFVCLSAPPGQAGDQDIVNFVFAGI